MINASKFNQGAEATIQEQTPIESNRKYDSNNDTSNRRRSQSCFDYQTMRRQAVDSGKSNSGSRRGHHSQENKRPTQIMPTQAPPPQQEKSNSTKPRSFIGEISKLTQLIEQEIGPSNRIYNNNANNAGKSVSKSKMEGKIKKSRPSVEIQRFIEKRKRETQVKKSLEVTIEHDKQNKIQQNLNTLEKYFKKGTIKPKRKSNSRPKSSKETS